MFVLAVYDDPLTQSYKLLLYIHIHTLCYECLLPCNNLVKVYSRRYCQSCMLYQLCRVHLHTICNKTFQSKSKTIIIIIIIIIIVVVVVVVVVVL